MIGIKQKFVSAGGNRQPNAADWKDDILAFGSGNNVAIWTSPENEHNGIEALLRGHTDSVNAVRLLSSSHPQRPHVLSGSSDKTLRLWKWRKGRYQQSASSTHEASVNTVSALPGSDLCATGSADGIVSIWSTGGERSDHPSNDSEPRSGEEAVGDNIHLIERISLKPRYLPLTTALTRLDDGSVLLAVAGTTKSIQLYLQQQNGKFHLEATLSGHDGWIRSLDFVRETNEIGGDILLASASQDKYIRLWRLHKGRDLPDTSTASQDPSLGVLSRSLSNKPHYIGDKDSLYSVTFEALLIGSEDWIYTAQWRSTETGPILLTTSADNSVSIWTRQQDSGYWICGTRLGEISSQKGSTTATGSAGGFWIGLWSPDGRQIASLGRTGSWRKWRWNEAAQSWQPTFGISGHVKAVRSIAWAANGTYLLSTGTDQTTRLYSPWVDDDKTTWHEVGRPQIHGYDLNCIDALGHRQFISGADEKLLRVFNMPKANAQLIDALAGDPSGSLDELPEAASMPVLGLSNKITTDDTQTAVGQSQGQDDDQAVTVNDLPLDHPPLEDVLARHTLWPEHEKLYGHGYEISAVAASHNHGLVATACKASSIDHAVIRLYETKDWREIRPSLIGHNLTVTSLAFSPDDSKLLTVGRDRQWMVYTNAATSEGPDFKLSRSNPKGHSRMILDCAWAPTEAGDIFVTAGRDKCVKVWHTASDEEDYSCELSIPTTAPATAVSVSSQAHGDKGIIIAVGTEEGEVQIVGVDCTHWVVKRQAMLQGHDKPAGPINALRWRPHNDKNSTAEVLAVASDDHSLRMFNIHIEDD